MGEGGKISNSPVRWLKFNTSRVQTRIRAADLWKSHVFWHRGTKETAVVLCPLDWKGNPADVKGLLNKISPKVLQTFYSSQKTHPLYYTLSGAPKVHRCESKLFPFIHSSQGTRNWLTDTRQNLNKSSFRCRFKLKYVKISKLYKFSYNEFWKWCTMKIKSTKFLKSSSSRSKKKHKIQSIRTLLKLTLPAPNIGQGRGPHITDLSPVIFLMINIFKWEKWTI